MIHKLWPWHDTHIKGFLRNRQIWICICTPGWGRDQHTVNQPDCNLWLSYYSESSASHHFILELFSLVRNKNSSYNLKHDYPYIQALKVSSMLVTETGDNLRWWQVGALWSFQDVGHFSHDVKSFNLEKSIT